MEKIETNTELIVNFFRNNFIKMIIFILISIILSLSFTIFYYKKNEVYYSEFKIIVNSAHSKLGSIVHPHLDIMFFLEKNGYKNKRLIQSKHSNNIVQLEIYHKSKDDKNTEKFNEYVSILKKYNQQFIDRLDKDLNNYIILSNEEMKKDPLNKEDWNYRIFEKKFQTERVKDLIINNKIYKVDYSGEIILRRMKTLITRNVVAAIVISLITIFLILWTKIFIREIRKNNFN